MITRCVRVGSGPGSLLAVVALAGAALAVVPPLAAQERSAAIGVRAVVVAPAGTEIGTPRVESVPVRRVGTRAITAPGIAAGAITARAREPRAPGAGEGWPRAGSELEARVRWEVAGRGGAWDTASAAVWVRDGGGALRPLVAGGAVSLGARPGGEHAPPTLHYRVDGAPGARVELVYEIRVIGVAQ